MRMIPLKKCIAIITCVLLAIFFISCKSISGSTRKSMTKTLQTSANQITEKIKEGVRIAVLNIQDVGDPGKVNKKPETMRSWFVLDLLTNMVVKTGKFVVVDRTSLEAIRMEQKFQLTGQVSDDTAISIGKLLGAEVVLTGAITKAGGLEYIRIKALDVKTGQILFMAYEKI